MDQCDELRGIEPHSEQGDYTTTMTFSTLRMQQDRHASGVSRNPSLRELRSFCVAAESGSFRAAAERLFITASAVSHQIKKLEDDLGQKLFERGTRTLTLTDTGRSLFAAVSPLLSQLDTAVSQHKARAVRSVLRISAQPFFASELLVPRLPAFRAAHPHIDIMIDTSDESPEKHPADTDVSIRVFRSPPSKLSAFELFPLRLVPASTPEFRDTLKLDGKRIVSEFPVIVHATRSRAWQKWQKHTGYQLPPETTSLHLDSMIAVARAAERGLGAALVPVQLSESWFRSGSLVRLFPDELTTDDSYYFVCGQTALDDANVIAVRDWVLQTFGSCS